MFYSELDDDDYAVLEGYWLRFQEFSTEEETNPIRKKNLDIITAAIEQQYNESDSLMREFIELRYFNATTKIVELKYLSVELGITFNQLSRLRKALLRETAELIAYV